MSSISTTRGDGGETGLLGGERIAKDHPRVEAIGTLDELSVFLGDAKCAALKARTREIIGIVQGQLMGLMGALALSPAAAQGRDTDSKAEAAETQLSAWVKEFEAKRPMKGFVIPGMSPPGARVDIARAVCRRAERRIAALHRLEPVSPAILRYINRLSDLLFLLARHEDDDKKEDEETTA
ncbi:MAG: cob(I)yrinic acid a,c-diamide adenosyltransferase [Spirochaetaceae bacterium]|jgi:cob(I)alamin adenosyltransferase|nr:cob(I)yrinic acid a,c-diamide adenosyltransferase [Spirochaetaceae bacterium]